jgi:hypothetical protein
MTRISPRDYLIILASFATVLASGFGTGHLIGHKQGLAAAERMTDTAEWQSAALANLDSRLKLRAGQIPLVEEALEQTASEIRASRHETMAAYLRHLGSLYESLDAILDPEQTSALVAERESLREESDRMLDRQRNTNPTLKP